MGRSTSTEPGIDAAGGPDLLEALVAAFAAADRGFAVLVRSPDPVASIDPTDPNASSTSTSSTHSSSTNSTRPRAPAAGQDVGILPTGSWLVATTSGTTGRPRAVCRSAASWVNSFEPLTRIAGLSARDTILITGPLSATMHLFAAVHTLAIGAHLTDRADQATAVHAVPQRLAALLAALPPTAPLRTAVVAGAALPDSLARRSLDRGLAVTEYYGAAELSFVAARRVPGPMRAFPGVDIRIDGDGVLWARSPYLALGYAGNQPGPLRRDRDGYATVGDLASVGTGGGLTVRGRGDAAISTGGHTVLAEDVEAVLGTLPGVGAVAVVGIAHPRFGQIVVAVLEPARRLKPSPDPPQATGSQRAAGRPAPRSAFPWSAARRRGRRTPGRPGDRRPHPGAGGGPHPAGRTVPAAAVPGLRPAAPHARRQDLPRRGGGRPRGWQPANSSPAIAGAATRTRTPDGRHKDARKDARTTSVPANPGPEQPPEWHYR